MLWLNVSFDLGLCGCVYCLHLFYLFVCSWMLFWCLVKIDECVCFGLFVVGLCLAGGFWSCHCCRLVWV